MPTLHIVGGPPASGKTRFGKELAARLGAAFLDIDTTTEPVVKAGLTLARKNPDDRDSPEFKSAFREPIYDALFDTAIVNLSHIDVVLTGPFTKEFQDANWLDSVRTRIGFPAKAYYVTADPGIRRKRLMKRNNPRDRAKLEDWASYIRYYGTESSPLFEHHFEDTSQWS